MDTGLLALFADIAHRGSFAAVARDRNVDPSLVSRGLATLEARLGLRLVQRTTRRLALTDAGVAYLARIEPLLAELEAAADAARDAEGPAGRLRLTASAAYGITRLIPLLAPFRALYPNIRLELLLSDANLDLIGEHIDLAIRLGPSIPAGAVGVRLHGMRYGLYASPAYVAATAPVAAPADLARHRCLLFAGPLQRREWRFTAADGVATDVAVDGDYSLSAPLAVLEAARAGLGPALFPDWLVANDVATGRLVHLLPGHVATTTGFGSDAWLLYPTRAHLPSRTRAAIDFLRARLGDAKGAMPLGPDRG